MMSPNNPRSRNLEIQLFEVKLRKKASRQNISDFFGAKLSHKHAKLKWSTYSPLNRQGLKIKLVQIFFNYVNINEEFNDDS